MMLMISRTILGMMRMRMVMRFGQAIMPVRLSKPGLVVRMPAQNRGEMGVRLAGATMLENNVQPGG